MSPPLSNSNLPAKDSNLANNGNTDVLDSVAEAIYLAHSSMIALKSLIQHSLSGIPEHRLFFNIERNGIFYGLGTYHYCFLASTSIDDLARDSAEEQKRVAKLLDLLIPLISTSLGVTISD